MDPYELLCGLILEDGRAWGEVATGWQRADARAILDHRPASPRLHLVTRPRAGSKTTDLAAVAIVALVCQAPARSVSHAFAGDQDQAGLLLRAIRGLVERTGLLGLLDVGAKSVTVRGSGASLEVESADARTAFGLTPFLTVVDEVAQWPSARNATDLWDAVVSGLVKRQDSRLVAITTAGDPAHWSARVREKALGSPRWRVSEVPGPLPWVDPDDLAEQARMLLPSAYARLHLNVWTAGEDRLTTPEDVAACVTHEGPLAPDSRYRYVAGLDLGLKNDRTVLAVCHVEYPERGALPVVVLDRLHVLAGSRDAPVQLADVEALALEAARTYRAEFQVDPYQAVGLAQRLHDRGLKVTERWFTPALVGQLATTMARLLGEHRLALPDDAELAAELATVRLKETSRPGVFRMDHDSGAHDDRAIALGLAAVALTERVEGRGMVSVPHRVPRQPQLLRYAQRTGPRGLPGGGGLLVPGSANDPDRVRVGG